MTESRIPVAGSLSAKIIRACARHSGKCPLDCKYRKVEDLGEVASFGPDMPAAAEEGKTDLVSRIKQLLGRE